MENRSRRSSIVHRRSSIVYMAATAGWMLIPAFLARGIVSGGFELARINGGIELAPPGKLIEYAALQSTTVGIRGILAGFSARACSVGRRQHHYFYAQYHLHCDRLVAFWAG